jgi:hypothetical protein
MLSFLLRNAECEEFRNLLLLLTPIADPTHQSLKPEKQGQHRGRTTDP